MDNQDYEQKKRECWEEYVNLLNHNSAARYVFDKIFDHAYTLGKEKESISQEDIEKAAIDYIRTNPFVNSRIATTARESFVDGVKFALGKQEKDAEGTVISGWVARDMNGELYIYEDKPKRDTMEWLGRLSPEFDLQRVKWSDDPIEVELIIKRKKNG